MNRQEQDQTNKRIKSLYFSREEIKPDLRNDDESEDLESRPWELHISEKPDRSLAAQDYSVCKGNFFVDANNKLVRVYDGLNENIANKVANNVDLYHRYNSIEQIDLELLVEGAQGQHLVPTRTEDQKYGPKIQYWEIK